MLSSRSVARESSMAPLGLHQQFDKMGNGGLALDNTPASSRGSFNSGFTINHRRGAKAGKASRKEIHVSDQSPMDLAYGDGHLDVTRPKVRQPWRGKEEISGAISRMAI